MPIAAFTDPRSEPSGPAGEARHIARTTTNPDLLTPLHHLCRTGRLYDIERWIQDGQPLQLADGITVKAGA